MSVKANVYNQKGEKVEDMNLSENVFSLEINPDLLYQAVDTQRSNERQVLAHTKTRSDVRGGGRKPWRQKGTGRARAGTNRSPIWIGGGITFGPSGDRNFKKKINIKMKKKALAMTLSDKAANNQLVVLDKIELPEFKTKLMEEVVSTIESKILKLKDAKRSVLVVNTGKDEKVSRSAKNLEGVKIINLDNINILDILKYRHLVFTKDVVKKLEERYK